jgi:hypothetical protein
MHCNRHYQSTELGGATDSGFRDLFPVVRCLASWRQKLVASNPCTTIIITVMFSLHTFQNLDFIFDNLFYKQINDSSIQMKNKDDPMF